eukprot:CAMPEP_0197904502 /NCGR_PEP_ID=MMETSP1439-20131203/58212_1 /TAXON_ID=66791 /ORGANISM="Gonyaulax spinifera, Strain CCMP409" /LENGTH=34 /DNA_ID= /DNA_START= /DNA_END= /DNA_ORIENTATION=
MAVKTSRRSCPTRAAKGGVAASGNGTAALRRAQS